VVLGVMNDEQDGRALIHDRGVGNGSNVRGLIKWPRFQAGVLLWLAEAPQGLKSAETSISLVWLTQRRQPALSLETTYAVLRPGTKPRRS